jgi:ribonuclease HI
MADKQKTKSQHTVPRCYLRGFADEKQNFYSFNKRYQKASPASVGQSAQSDFFYDFEPSTLQNPTDDPQLVEKTFALLENRFKEVLDDVIAGAKTGEVRAESADYLAQFIALQWLRTRGARNTLVEVDVKTMQALVNQWYAITNPGMPPAKFRTEPGYAQALQANMIFDCDNVMKTAERFWNLVWVIGRNRTDHPFYTSDEPVVRRQNPVINDTSLPVPPGIGI